MFRVDGPIVPVPTGGTRVWVAAYVRRGTRVLVRDRSRGIDLGMLGPPGGSVEPGESLEAALARELEEETGRQLGSARLLTVMHDTVNSGVVFFYRVEFVLRLAPARTEPGHQPWRWVETDELRRMGPDLVQRGLANWLGCDTPGCVRVVG